MSGEKVKLTGLWRNEAKDGSIFYSGSLGAAKVLVFKNNYKKENRDPDLVLYLAPSEKREKKPEPAVRHTTQSAEQSLEDAQKNF